MIQHYVSDCWPMQKFKLALLSLVLLVVQIGSAQTTCSGVGITNSGGTINISGLDGAPISTVQVFNSTWEKIFTCMGDCATPTQAVTGLPAGQYYVKVDLYQANWQHSCTKEGFYTVAGGNGGGGSSCGLTYTSEITNKLCSDNGTPNYSGDDTWTFFFNAIVATNPNNAPASTWTSNINGLACQGIYGTPKALGPYAISAGNVVFTVTDDSNPGCSKQFTVTPPSSCSNGGGSALPTVSINDVTVNESAGTATFSVALSSAQATPVTVAYSTSNQTAVSGNDYTAKSGTITFPAWTTTQTVQVQITDDNVNEPSELLNVILSNPVGATIADGTGVITITDNDTNNGGGQPDCNNITMAASGNSINFSGLSAPIVAVQIFNSSWSTVYNQYFTNSPGTLTVPNLGSDNYYAKVDLLTSGWSSICKKEGFILVSGTTVPSTPSVSISDVTVNEQAGTATLNLTLSSAASQPVTVSYATANASALSTSDYTTKSGSVTFPAGITSMTVQFAIQDDNATEPTESFNVVLSNPVGLTIADNTGIVTILDNDTATPPPTGPDCGTISFTGNNGAINFSGLNAPIVMVQIFNSAWATVYNQYFTTAPGTLNVPNLPAGNYYVKVDFLNAQWGSICKKEQFLNVTAGGGGTPVVPTISISDITVNETAGVATLTVTASQASSSPITFQLQTSDGSAVNGQDYQAVNSTFTIPANSLTTVVSFPIVDNLVAEATESFSAIISGATGATVADGTGLVTILDNDVVAALPVISVNDVTVNENEGIATVTVSIPAPSNTPVTATITTVPGTATNGTDYTAQTQTVYIPAGSTSTTVSFVLINDQNPEPTENFQVQLSNPSGATLGDNLGIITILDTDVSAPAVVSISCPANITVTTTGNATSAAATYSLPTSSTTCPGGFTNVFRTSGLASGAQFPVGVTQVCYVATDNCSNSTSCCFTVTVANQGCVNVDNPGTISGEEIATCSGTFDPAIISSTAAASGGIGALEYQWVCSTTGCPTTSSHFIVGANGATYNPPVQVDQVVWYARLARRAGCNNNAWQISNCIKKEKKTDSLLAQWDFNQCVNEESTGANAFTAIPNAPSFVTNCSAFEVTPIRRRADNWSGNCPNIDLGARCRPGGYINFSFIDPNYNSTSNSALLFNVSVGGGTGAGKLTSLEIVQKGGFNEPLLLNNCGRVPPPVRVDPYAVRILKNGIEIFRKVDVPISLSNWATDLFQFCDNNAFNYVGGDVFTFELQAYDAGLAANQEFVWSVDDIKLRGTCDNTINNNITTGNCPARTAVLVVENIGDLVVDEVFLRDVLIKKGFAVTLRNNSTITAADVNGKNLVVLSPEIQVSNTTVIPTTTSPLVVFGCVQHAFRANRMASVDQTSNALQFTAPYFYTGAEPISAGLVGQQRVFNTESRIHFDVRPSLVAQTISYWGADISQAANRNVVFSYDMGDLMPAVAAYYHGVPTENILVPAKAELNAPNRRVGLAWGRNFSAHIMPDAVRVMDEAIDWAASCPTGNGGSGLAFNCVNDIQVRAAYGATSAVVNYTAPFATTACPGGQVHIERKTGFQSGYNFPVGTTRVCYEATDACGNVATCCFDISVIDEKVFCGSIANAGTIAGDQIETCSGTFNPTVIGSVSLPTAAPSGVSPVFEYAWVCSYTGCPSVNSVRIQGANQPTYDPPVQTAPVIYYARMVRLAGCDESAWVLSNCIKKENAGTITLANWDFNSCVNNIGGANAFTSIEVEPSYHASCAALDVSAIRRRDNAWSGACPNIGTGARCRPGGYMNFHFTQSAYSSTSAATLIFNVAIGGAAQPGKLTGLQIRQRAGVNEPELLNNCGLVPAPVRVDPYAVRILKNGVELFRKVDVDISAVSWATDMFDFCGDANFSYQAGDLFQIELLAYDGGLRVNEEFAWSVDDIKVFGTCSSALSDVITPNTCSNKTALLVVENANSLVIDETFLKKALEKKGYNVAVRENSTITNADATGKNLIVLSPEIRTPNTSVLPTTTSPMIVFGCIQNAFLANRMASVDETANATFFTNPYLYNNNHYIGSDRVGQVKTFNTEERIHFMTSPSALASIISYWGTDPSQSPSRAAVFAYEMGALMPATPATYVGDNNNRYVAALPSINAPNRRVGFAWGRNFSAHMTVAAAEIVNEAIDWAAKCVTGTHLINRVDALTFAAQKESSKTAKLRWATNIAQKSEGFVVERSADNQNFETIHFENTLVGGDNVQQFVFSDEKPVEGMNYYRIKMQMIDGTETYSQVEALDFSAVDGIAVYPNPAVDKLYISLEDAVASQIEVQVVNQLGTVVKTVTLSKNVGIFELGLENLERGLYFVRITPEGSRPVSKKIFVESLD